MIKKSKIIGGILFILGVILVLKFVSPTGFSILDETDKRLRPLIGLILIAVGILISTLYGKKAIHQKLE